MSAEDIERLIPHRPPMRLLDEIVSRDDATIVCRKTFHQEDFFVQGHFPDYPLVPGVIQCECCLQAGAILLAEQTRSAQSERQGDLVPVATGMDSVKFKRMVRPGDTVEIAVLIDNSLPDLRGYQLHFNVTGTVLVGRIGPTPSCLAIGRRRRTSSVIETRRRTYSRRSRQ